MNVSIDGKEFELKNVGLLKPSRGLEGFTHYEVTGIFIDAETLFTTKEKEVLINRAPVRLFYQGELYEYGCVCTEPQRYIKNLRQIVASNYLQMKVKEKKKDFPKMSCTLQSVLDVLPYLGKSEIAMSNCGYGDCKPIYGFVGIVYNQKKTSFNLELYKDEGIATLKTQEAVEFIYGRTLRKKGLSPEAKQEFEDAVNEFSRGLDITNLEERVSFLEELYNDLRA